MGEPPRRQSSLPSNGKVAATANGVERGVPVTGTNGARVAKHPWRHEGSNSRTPGFTAANTSARRIDVGRRSLSQETLPIANITRGTAQQPRSLVETEDDGLESRSNQVKSLERIRRGLAPSMAKRQLDTHISVEGITGHISDVKESHLLHRLLGHEIQGVMHASGEIRLCSRAVLEIVEDAVREGIKRILAEAVYFAEPYPGASGIEPVTVTIAHVAHVIRRDLGVCERLKCSIRGLLSLYKDKPEGAEMKEYVETRLTYGLTNSIAAIADLGDEGENEKNSWSISKQPGGDPLKYCTWNSYHLFRNMMPKPEFDYYLSCRAASLVSGHSNSPWKGVEGQPRLRVFELWLELGKYKETKLSTGALYALGHLARECVGALTQTALYQKHEHEVDSGIADYQCKSWTFERNVLAAIGHGLASGVLIPLTDLQLFKLGQEIESFARICEKGEDALRGKRRNMGRALEPFNIKEALRRDLFDDSVLLSYLRGRHPRFSIH